MAAILNEARSWKGPTETASPGSRPPDVKILLAARDPPVKADAAGGSRAHPPLTPEALHTGAQISGICLFLDDDAYSVERCNAAL